MAESPLVGAVVEGFATIGVVIGVGFLLAHLHVLDAHAQVVLSRLAFFVASPALMVTVLAGADVHHALSRNLAATACGVLVAATLYGLAARRVFRHDVGDTVIGMLCSSYVNAGNLGLPIAAYVLGDAALVAPTLLLQLLFLQPLALAVLDSAGRETKLSWWSLLRRPLTTPLTVGSLLGVVLSLTGTELPRAVADPLELLGGIAVPAMLVAYGVSLRLGPLPGAGPPPGELAWVSTLKLVVQPVVAGLVAAYALGLGGTDLLAVVVTSALPTAQNIFVHANRYQRAVLLARDAIFVTTLASVPVIFVAVAVLT
ncbi:AEC family transporter [Micromonospora sp. MS34]|uniref:AEC family transporter n=1 Tax=Micromonospora sp. MS34 TaxID=3385971 RepID=UPI00399F229F